MKVVAKNIRRKRLENFCKAVEDGEILDKEVLADVSRMLRNALNEIDSIGQKWIEKEKTTKKDPKRSEKIGRILGKHLGLIGPKQRPAAGFEEHNEKTSKVLQYIYEEEKVGREEALQNFSERESKSERTIEGWIKKHKDSAIALKWLVDSKETTETFFCVAERVVKGKLQPRRQFTQHIIEKQPCIVRPPTYKQLKEIEGFDFQNSSPENHVKLIDWWFSNTVFESADGQLPAFPGVILSEYVAGYSIRFIESVISLYK